MDVGLGLGVFRVSDEIPRQTGSNSKQWAVLCRADDCGNYEVEVWEGVKGGGETFTYSGGRTSSYDHFYIA